MEPGVLDSSALLAVLQSERGSEVVQPILLRSVISAVNAAEVQAKLVREGKPAEIAWRVTSSATHQIIAFNADQAKLCGSLISQTKSAGLSFGDRACLALAIHMNLPVYTADRAWSRVSSICDIRFIR